MAQVGVCAQTLHGREPRLARGAPRAAVNVLATPAPQRPERILAMEEGIARTRLDPDTTDRFLALRRQLGVSSFGINQIVLRPGERGRIHRHRLQEEVYVVLEGRLTLLVEGEETEAGEGELIRVAPAVRRQLVNRGPRRLVLLALGGYGEHQGRDGEAFASWEQQVGVAPQELPLPPDLSGRELRS